MNTPSSVATAPLTSPQVKGLDTSPTSFLPGLKSFNIDTSKYKHYGHQLLMNAQAIERLVTQPDKDKKKADSRSSLILSQANASPLEPHRDMLRALDLPNDTKWAYSEETLAEMVRLRTEQERTKQIQIKYELGHVVLELLKEAEHHGFAGELIRRLFLDGPHEAEEYRQHMQYLRTMPEAPLKRKYLDDSAHASSVHTPGHTPSQLPNKLPLLAEAVADGSHAHASHPSPPHLALHLHLNLALNLSQQVPVAAPSRSRKTLQPAQQMHTVQMQNGLPNLPVLPQHIYPVYYQVPEQFSHKKNPLQLDESETLGLPYLQKYPTVVFQQNQNRQPYYYVNLQQQAMGGPIMGSQFIIPPPLSQVMPWQVAPPPVEKKEEEAPHKKHRSSKNGINFMITTPKNPPAKKYNKL